MIEQTVSLGRLVYSNIRMGRSQMKWKVVTHSATVERAPLIIFLDGKVVLANRDTCVDLVLNS